MYPDTLMLGMEIRVKVSDYVHDRIVALRKANPGQYDNISVIRTNAMKWVPVPTRFPRGHSVSLRRRPSFRA